MNRLYRLMEAIGHAHAYTGKPFAPTNSGRAADTAGRPTHQPKPQAPGRNQ